MLLEQCNGHGSQFGERSKQVQHTDVQSPDVSLHEWELDIVSAGFETPLNVESEFYPAEARKILAVMSAKGFTTYADTVRWLTMVGLGAVTVQQATDSDWLQDAVVPVVTFIAGLAAGHFIHL